MDIHVNDLLPKRWQEVAACVDSYDAALKDGLPNLRQLAQRVSLESRPAALVELVAVDMENRWETGKPKTVERYLEEFPEMLAEPKCAEDLIAQEFQVRCDSGEEPTIDEYRCRFPDIDVQKLVGQAETGTVRPNSVTRGVGSGQSPLRADSKGIDRAPDPPPETIGRYRVEEEVGAGAFGRVYRCFDTQLKRNVAVKLPHTSKTPTSERLKEFLHEARSAARLRHARIVSVLDAGKLDDGRPYVVYEYVPGETLRARIKTKTYTREEAIAWCVEIAQALHFAHAHHIVHRDVSPDNILLDEKGHIRLTDFGLSKMDDEFFRDDRGKVLGSLVYISPEQARGEAHWSSPQSDIYSLGVILYELLTGRRPFSLRRTPDIEEVLAQIERRNPDPPRTIDDSISTELENVCLKAMAKDPTGRHNTAADMADQLREAVTPKTAAVRHLPPRWPKIGLAFFASAALVVLALVLLPAIRGGGDGGGGVGDSGVGDSGGVGGDSDGAGGGEHEVTHLDVD